MQYTRHNQPVYVRLDGERKEIALTLIANMIVTPEQAAQGTISRVLEQGRYQLLPEMMPIKELAFERLVLRLLYTLYDEKIPATRENIITRARLEYSDAEERVDALLNHRTLHAGVTSNAFSLGDWMEQQRMVVAAQKIMERVNIRDGNALDAYTEGLRLWNAAAPGDRSITIVSDDFLRNHRRLQMERQERLRSGRATGPTFPWAGLRKKIPALKKGDMCTWLAKSKHGKSSIVLLLAEHIAHTCADGEGYDVAVFHLETTAESLADRWIARKCKVKPGALRQPEIFDITREPYKSKYDRAQSEWEHNQKHRGRVSYIHCPGIGPSEFATQVAAMKAQAESRGRELVVILDYYQEMDTSELSQYETTGLNTLATRLKNIAEAKETNCYLIVFAQYGIDQEYSSKKAGFGGQKIVQRSQVVIRVERDDATTDYPILNTKSNEQIRDACNVPMFYHEAGQPDARAWLNVILANDDEAGVVPVIFINGYFECFDDLWRSAADYHSAENGKAKAASK